MSKGVLCPAKHIPELGGKHLIHALKLLEVPVVEEQGCLPMLYAVIRVWAGIHRNARFAFVEGRKYLPKPRARGHVVIAFGHDENHPLVLLQEHGDYPSKGANHYPNQLLIPGIGIQNVPTSRRHCTQTVVVQ